jgi:ribose transport system ATP-binding protein
VTQIAEGASGTPALPRGAREFASDFVTFRIPGYGRGYGGPWPPDDAHRYVFTLYALKADRIELDDTADYVAFVRAVLPSTIMTATLVGLYGPAKVPLPNPA